MRSYLGLVTLSVAAAAATAQTGSDGSGGGGPSGGGKGPPQVTFRISDETAPPGGVAQMKLLLTEPTPISSGRPHIVYDDSIFDEAWGIEMFASAGRASGVATINGNSISISFLSVGESTGNDYPFMTVALHLRPDAAPGSKTQFNLAPSSAWTVGSVAATMTPIVPANVTVGGSISITNVIPGGGLLPSGSIVKVQGLGFEAHTRVQLSSFSASSIAVVSPTEIDLVLAQATDMTGKKIQVVNPDGSQDTYYSYLRGIDLGASNFALLGTAVPIFSAETYSQATFTQITTAESSQFTGVALQNPDITVATVNVSLYSAAGTETGMATLTIPPGYRLMREIGEMVGSTPAPGGYLEVSSNQSIQMFGFLADQSTQLITPFVPASVLP